MLDLRRRGRSLRTAVSSPGPLAGNVLLLDEPSNDLDV
jgi:ATPase subunit of ABC transporter with duplicated ATPase domains